MTNTKGWWDDENRLMDFKRIDHRTGTIDGSSAAYDEMMGYLNLKLEAQREDKERKKPQPKCCCLVGELHCEHCEHFDD